jgi:uncharacterized protein YjeT (DUF2065 family)
LVGLAFIGVDKPLNWGGAGTAAGIFLLITAVPMLLLPKLHRRLAPALTVAVAGHERWFGLASVLLAVGLSALLAAG